MHLEAASHKQTTNTIHIVKIILTENNSSILKGILLEKKFSLKDTLKSTYIIKWTMDTDIQWLIYNLSAHAWA